MGMGRIVGTMAVATLALVLLVVGAVGYQGYKALVIHSGTNDPLASEVVITNAREGNSRRFREGYGALTNAEEFHHEREVRLSLFVEPEDLLRTGERLPARGEWALFAETRASQYAREECARLMEVLARDCEVERAHSSLRDDLVRLSLTLRFVPLDPLGDLDAETAYAFDRTVASLTDLSYPVPINRTAELRMQVYEHVRETCNLIRQREGACAVGHIMMNFSQASSLTMQRFTGQVGYLYLSPTTGLTASTR